MSGRGDVASNRYLLQLAKAPHLGKAGIGLLALLVGADAWAEVAGRISLITAGFLAFAALTATLCLLSLYDLVVSVFRLRYGAIEGGAAPAPFRIGSDVLVEYARWLSPLGFVVGIIVGHYYWQ